MTAIAAANTRITGKGLEMYRLLLLATMIAIAGCREENSLSPHLGAYYGGFDTALTADPTDDLNPNECSLSVSKEECQSAHGNPLSHLLLKLGLTEDGKLTLGFYRTRDDYEADQPMYLSTGCRTSIGPAQDYRLHPIDKSLDQTQVLATANFPLRFGKEMLACTDSARFSATPNPHMDLALQVNPVTGASAISVTMEKSRRDGDYLYVKKDGEKIPIKLDLRYVGTDDLESRRVCAADGETSLENKDGYRAVCVMTGRRKWSVVLPLSPYGPGVTAFWGSTRSPKWYRTSGEPDIVTYHNAIFVPVQLESGDSGLAD
jgi:hypothetical protein